MKKPYFASSVQVTLVNTYFLTFSSTTLLPQPKYLLTMTLNLPHIHHSNKPELHTQHTAIEYREPEKALFSFKIKHLYGFELKFQKTHQNPTSSNQQNENPLFSKHLQEFKSSTIPDFLPEF